MENLHAPRTGIGMIQHAGGKQTDNRIMTARYFFILFLLWTLSPSLSLSSPLSLSPPIFHFHLCHFPKTENHENI